MAGQISKNTFFANNFFKLAWKLPIFCVRMYFCCAIPTIPNLWGLFPKRAQKLSWKCSSICRRRKPLGWFTSCNPWKFGTSVLLYLTEGKRQVSNWRLWWLKSPFINTMNEEKILSCCCCKFQDAGSRIRTLFGYFVRFTVFIFSSSRIQYKVQYTKWFKRIIPIMHIVLLEISKWRPPCANFSVLLTRIQNIDFFVNFFIFLQQRHTVH